jgi:phosphatidylglycerophosphate synthase
MTVQTPAAEAKRRHRVMPSLVTALRLVAIPAIGALWLREMRPAAIGLYGLVVLSDALDGWLARRYDAVTRFGAFFDAITDIAVILFLLALLSWNGVVPVWVPIAPAVVACLFLATSSRAAPRYDPIGKYYGAILYVVVGVLLWGVGPAIRTALNVVVPVASAVVLVSRWMARPKPTARRSK